MSIKLIISKVSAAFIRHFLSDQPFIYSCGSYRHCFVITLGGSGMSCCRTEMVIYLQERLPNGTVKRILASTLHKFLCQAQYANPLKTGGVLQIIPKASMSADALKYYLDTPPAGIISRQQTWQTTICMCLMLWCKIFIRIQCEDNSHRLPN